jgi:hypothetical protein
LALFSTFRIASVSLRSRYGYLVLRTTIDEETIVDPFMGSGSIEIEEWYCEIAAKRLSQEVLPFEMPQSANGEQFQPSLYDSEERQPKESE